MVTKTAMMSEFREKLKDKVAKTSPGSTTVQQKGKIQRVPAVLREQKELGQYFEPRWISFGPIHYGKPKLKAAEKHKLELVAKFIRDNGYKSDEELYGEIKIGIDGLIWECFDEEAFDKDFDKETLNWILFFDGCTILQFIHSCSKKDDFKELKIKNDQIAFINHDLFLLENQIPYRVLELLMNAKKVSKKEELQKSLKNFIRKNVMAPEKYQKDFKVDANMAHLLDLLRVALIQPSEPDPKPAHRCELPLRNPQKEGTDSRKNVDAENPPEPSQADKKKEGTKDFEQQSFRSVQDLRAAGINLKPSKSCSLNDIKFTSVRFAGELELPRLIVDDSMAPKFMNLIAYEMCPDNMETKYEVTSYICFLDSLIDYPADVKELRTAEILNNLLGCDKDVARLFNRIATDLVPNLKVYEKVIEKIEKHYKNRWMTWMAQVYSDHFSTPWTIVTFFAAVLALFMSGVQTWFTVYSPPDA
ncbi:hypothetical protein L484_005823 [Morus notabilis]|uniref:Uncharacterized protein n=1 Tax=Morus notabilis TaxID=981085 RepID=W9SCX4_9ROSA|nr:UPF0481 protein At3g47200 isoform X2 [Morus notabilis]EXC00010.1 hypothetical protein L484_005823 [Morus notabilis]